MKSTPGSIASELKRLSASLRRIEKRLQSEPAPSPIHVNDFRQAVENVRLTAWTVSELINAKQTRRDPGAVLSFVAAERLRRFDQLVISLAEDIDRRFITLESNGIEPLLGSIEMLQRRLKQSSLNNGRKQKIKAVASLIFSSSHRPRGPPLPSSPCPSPSRKPSPR